MPAKIRALIDIDVLLDVLQQRELFYTMSARALACAETGQIEGWVAAHSITTLYYLYAKYQSAEQARIRLSDLLSFLSVAAVDRVVIEHALTLPYRDFEDAVQMAAAIQIGAQYVITRNVSDYKEGPLPAIAPAELLALV